MGPNTEELISMVESLPIEIKIKLIEKILNSIHPSQKEIDELWAQEVEKRLKDVQNGKVKPIPADKIFEEVHKMYNK